MTCEYFGIKTAKMEKQVKCQKCRQQTIAVFTKCTYETNFLLSTSVDVVHGKTVIVPPTGKVPDDKLLVEL